MTTVGSPPFASSPKTKRPSLHHAEAGGFLFVLHRVRSREW